jgi:hypothetical protein
MFYLARPIIKQLIAESNGDFPKQDNNQVEFVVSDKNNSKQKGQIHTENERKKIFDRIQNLGTYKAYESFQAEEIESRQSLSDGSKIAAGCNLKVILKDDKTFNFLMEVNESRPVGELGYRSTFWLSTEKLQKYFRI